MKVLVLFSGGKDSVFATHWALLRGWEVTLLSIQAKEFSEKYHFANLKWTSLQAEAMGLPLLRIEEGREKEAMEGYDALVTGVVESSYQRFFLEDLAEELGLRTYHPLWMKERQGDLFSDFTVIFVLVAAHGLGPELLGKPLRELPNYHPFFEGGEAETFVLDAPLFSFALRPQRTRKVWEGTRGYLVIEEMEKVKKRIYMR